MIPILIPSPAVASVGPHTVVRADQARRPVELRVVRDARPDGRAGDAAQRRELPARHGDRDPVQRRRRSASARARRGCAPGSSPGACAAPTRACGGTRRSRSRGGRAGGARSCAAASPRSRSTASASGGCGSVTTTSTSPALAEPAGPAGVPAPAAASSMSDPRTAGRNRAKRRRIDTVHASAARRAPGYNVPPRGCGGIGRRARFRSVWAKARGGSSPLIRIAVASRDQFMRPRRFRSRRKLGSTAGVLSFGAPSKPPPSGVGRTGRRCRYSWQQEIREARQAATSPCRTSRAAQAMRLGRSTITAAAGRGLAARIARRPANRLTLRCGVRTKPPPGVNRLRGGGPAVRRPGLQPVSLLA